MGSTFLDNLEWGGLGYALRTANNAKKFDREVKRFNKKYKKRMAEFEKDPNRIQPSEEEVRAAAKKIAEEAEKDILFKLVPNDEEPEQKTAATVQVTEETPQPKQVEEIVKTVQETVTEKPAGNTSALDKLTNMINVSADEVKDIIEKVEADAIEIMNREDKVRNLKQFDADRLAKNINDCKEALATEGCTEEEIRIVVFAMLFASMLLDVETLYKSINPNPEISKKEIEGINGLLRSWTGIVINQAYATPELEDIMEPAHLNKIVQFEKDYDGASCPIGDVISGLTSKDVKTIEDKAASEATPEEAVITPIKFIDPMGNVEFYAPRKIGKGDIRFYENANRFGDVLKGYKHRFHNVGVVDEVVIENDPANPRWYSLDHGHIFGIGAALLVDVPTGNGGYTLYPVSTKYDKDIVQRYINDPTYVPTMDEIMRMASRLYPDTALYSNYDLSGISNIKNALGDDLNKFYDKLVKISKLPWNLVSVNNQPMPIVFPRMRIQTFKSLDNFILISDYKVKVPYFDGFNHLTSPVTIKVNGDNLNVEIGMTDGTSINFNVSLTPVVTPVEQKSKKDEKPKQEEQKQTQQPQAQPQNDSLEKERNKRIAEYNAIMIQPA